MGQANKTRNPHRRSILHAGVFHGHRTVSPGEKIVQRIHESSATPVDVADPKGDEVLARSVQMVCQSAPLEHGLRENWTFRRKESYVEKVLGQLKPNAGIGLDFERDTQVIFAGRKRVGEFPQRRIDHGHEIRIDSHLRRLLHGRQGVNQSRPPSLESTPSRSDRDCAKVWMARRDVARSSQTSGLGLNSTLAVDAAVVTEGSVIVNVRLGRSGERLVVDTLKLTARGSIRWSSGGVPEGESCSACPTTRTYPAELGRPGPSKEEAGNAVRDRRVLDPPRQPRHARAPSWSAGEAQQSTAGRVVPERVQATQQAPRRPAVDGSCTRGLWRRRPTG